MKHQPSHTNHQSHLINCAERELNLINDQRLQNRWDFSIFFVVFPISSQVVLAHLHLPVFVKTPPLRFVEIGLSAGKINTGLLNPDEESRLSWSSFGLLLDKSKGLPGLRVLLIHRPYFLFPGFPKNTDCCNFAKIFRL